MRELLNITDFKDRLETCNYLNANIIEKNLILRTIPLNNIIFFQEKGEINYTVSVSGGSGKGGGANLAGAVLGGLAFGKVGAVVGSQYNTDLVIDEVQSETIEHDNRYVVFKYYDDNGMAKEERFAYDYYDIFISLIPEKEYSYVQLNATNNYVAINSNDTENITNQIKQLKALLDEEYITQEEFELKKKQLLGI